MAAPSKKKKQLPPWLEKKTGTSDGNGATHSASGDKTGKTPSKNAPTSSTPADKRKQGRGAKPGPVAGTAAAKKGSAKGGRKSRKK